MTKRVISETPTIVILGVARKMSLSATDRSTAWSIGPCERFLSEPGYCTRVPERPKDVARCSVLLIARYDADY